MVSDIQKNLIITKNIFINKICIYYCNLYCTFLLNENRFIILIKYISIFDGLYCAKYIKLYFFINLVIKIRQVNEIAGNNFGSKFRTSHCAS